jgi:hypothetical protein
VPGAGGDLKPVLISTTACPTRTPRKTNPYRPTHRPEQDLTSASDIVSWVDHGSYRSLAPMTVLPMISSFRLRSSITTDSTPEPTPAGPVPKPTAAVPHRHQLGAGMAGVIGRRRFLYDLWGDTVNMANRMESHGTPTPSISLARRGSSCATTSWLSR